MKGIASQIIKSKHLHVSCHSIQKLIIGLLHENISGCWHSRRLPLLGTLCCRFCTFINGKNLRHSLALWISLQHFWRRRVCGCSESVFPSVRFSLILMKKAPECLHFADPPGKQLHHALVTTRLSRSSSKRSCLKEINHVRRGDIWTRNLFLLTIEVLILTMRRWIWLFGGS